MVDFSRHPERNQPNHLKLGARPRKDAQAPNEAARNETICHIQEKKIIRNASQIQPHIHSIVTLT
jgi:hypothetical protein